MAQINITKTDVLNTPSAGLTAIGVKSSNELFLVDETGTEIPVGGGGGLEGTQYVYVAANGTDVENAAELQAAYVTAQGMSPTATNRITVIASPANYNFATNFVMTTQFIDLVSLDGNRSVIFNGVGTISVTANDVFVKGVNVGNKEFNVGDSLNLLKVENCQGGDGSFGSNGTASGTFTNCQGGDNSFGGFGTASGTFTNCQGGDNSFATGGTASGTFKDCRGGDNSFGAFETASGTFTNCVGVGSNSFGGFGTASGTFTDCIGGDQSFGAFAIASGIFTNCQGDDGSFGGFGGTLNGKLFYCRLTSGTFETVSGAGITRLCIDGNNNENNQG